MSIFSRLKEYAARDPSRWHTPGHKGTLDPLDLTELADGSFPAESVRQAENKAAGFYGAQALRFLTGGSSMGIKAAILSAGGDIIAPDSCHRALDEGARLAKKRLYTFSAGSCGPDGLPGIPSLAQAEAAVRDFPEAKAVYLESPDYFGRTVDPAIPEIIKKAGMLFFCDAAHGAHFPAHPGLFPKGYSGIADACNLSAHKTLDAYTQAAYLCVNNEKLLQKIDCALALLGTTSPSYLLLASLETAAENAQSNRTEYERLSRDCAAFRKEVPCLPNDDFSRLCVDAGVFGLTGGELCGRLIKENIYAEKHLREITPYLSRRRTTKRKTLSGWRRRSKKYRKQNERRND